MAKKGHNQDEPRAGWGGKREGAGAPRSEETEEMVRSADALTAMATVAVPNKKLEEKTTRFARTHDADEEGTAEALEAMAREIAESGDTSWRKPQKQEVQRLVGDAHGVTPEAVKKAQQRLHKRWNEEREVPRFENDDPDATGLTVVVWEAEDAAPPLPRGEPCRCEHHHCTCDHYPDHPGISCGRIFSADVPAEEWPEGHRPGKKLCRCPHRHCRVCGVAMGDGDPYVFLDNFYNPETQRFDVFGWICRECDEKVPRDER